MSQSLHVFNSHWSNGKRTMSWEICLSGFELVQCWMLIFAYCTPNGHNRLSRVASVALHIVMRPRTKCSRSQLAELMHARIQGGGCGTGVQKKHKNICIYKQYWSGSPENHKATMPAFNVGADDGTLEVVFGSSLPHSDETFWIHSCDEFIEIAFSCKHMQRRRLGNYVYVLNPLSWVKGTTWYPKS